MSIYKHRHLGSQPSGLRRKLTHVSRPRPHRCNWDVSEDASENGHLMREEEDISGDWEVRRDGAGQGKDRPTFPAERGGANPAREESEADGTEREGAQAIISSPSHPATRSGPDQLASMGGRVGTTQDTPGPPFRHLSNQICLITS